MKTHPWIATSMTLIIALSSVAPSYAKNPAHKNKPAPTVEKPQEVSIDALFTQLHDAKAARNSIQSAIALSKIKKAVFNGQYGATYVEKLKKLDALSERDANTGYDVAKALQLHWEAKFGPELNTRSVTRTKTSTEVGAVLGITALGVSLIRNPTNVPKYFRVLRHLLPLVGVAGGYATAGAINKTGWLDHDVPVAPAQVMRLGVITDDQPSMDDFVTDLVALTASTAAATLAYDLLLVAKGARWLNVAITPAKIHPLALIGSIVVGYIVDEGVTYAAGYFQWKSHKDAINSEKMRFERAFSQGNHIEALRAAESLTDAITAASRDLSRPIYEKMEDYTQDIAKLDPQRQSGRINKLSNELAQDVRDIYKDKMEYRYEYGEMDDTISVLNVIIDQGRAGVDDMDPWSSFLGKTEFGMFDIDMKYNPERKTTCIQIYGSLDECLKARLISKRDGMTDQLAHDFRYAKFIKEPRFLFLQGASFLAQYRQEYLEDSINTLVTHHQRARQLLKQVGAF